MKSFLRTFKLVSMASAFAALGIFSFVWSAQADTIGTTNNITTSSGTATSRATTMTPSTSNVSIMVMNHLCNANIKNIQDFQALEAGKNLVAALANTVLNCPTTGLAGNEAVMGTVASPRSMYTFQVNGENGNSQTLVNANFMQHKLCESDIQIDVNNDGTISPTTCLDISHYEFPNVQTLSGNVSIMETMFPTGFHFGTLRFTPTGLMPNNDASSLISASTTTGTIQLSTNGDTDKLIMLHIYNFQNSVATSTTSSTTSTTIPITTPTTTTISPPTSILSQIPNFEGNFGWLVLPLTKYNQIINSTSTPVGSTSQHNSFTMINGYPTLNGNYYDCYGNIDNDMGHHSTNASDTDPGHHTGQNCSGVSPMVPQSMSGNNNSVASMLNSNGIGSFFMVQGNFTAQYVVVLFTSGFLQKMINFLMANH